MLLNICICFSAAGLADQLGRCGGGRSKVTYSMSIGARLSFKTPRLSERKFHQTSLGTEKTSATHAPLWIPSAAVWFVCTNTANCNESECSLHQGVPTELNKMTTRVSYSGDLRVGDCCFFRQQSEKEGRLFCPQDLFVVQTPLRAEQIGAGLLTDYYYPNRRDMMGIICCATQLQ